MEMHLNIDNSNEHKGTDKVVEPMSMNPKKFALWLFIISVAMVFAALTSAYVVRRGEGNWLDFELPSLLWVSTILIVISSGTMHLAYLSAKKDNLNMVRIAMGITTLLGVLFLAAQYYSWQELQANNIPFTDPNTPAGSFVYVFTGLHGVHIVSAIIFLIIVLVAAFRFKVHSRNMNQISMCATYWHFLDGLWIYLFIFLLMNH